jgi:hypothetical protein
MSWAGYVLAVSDDSPLRPFEDQARRRHLFGQVEYVSGETLTVAGSSGSVQVAASAAWLEPTKRNFTDLLEHLAGHHVGIRRRCRFCQVVVGARVG